MSSAFELRLKIEQSEIPHSTFSDHYTWLHQRIQDKLDGANCRGEWLIGPSRAGKSMLMEALCRAYPWTEESGARYMPVVPVTLESPITPKRLPRSILRAMEVPIPRSVRSEGELFERLVDQMRLAKVRVLLVDEASAVVEVGARVPPRAAAESFKTLTDHAGLMLIMLGVPRLARLFESNEQLRNRMNARRELRPYDFHEPAEWRAFASCIKTFSRLFAESGWPIGLPLETLAQHCYLASGGLIGVVSNFMVALSVRPRQEEPRGLTMEDCFRAAATIELAGHPQCPPFSRLEVTPVELNQAHTHVLEAAGLPRKPKKQGPAS